MGLSTRSDTNAAEQMQALVEPFGYELHLVRVTGCLHLKSAVTQVREDTLLINPDWVDKRDFAGVKFIEIDASEPYAANAVLDWRLFGLPELLSEDPAPPGSVRH